MELRGKPSNLMPTKSSIMRIKESSFLRVLPCLRAFRSARITYTTEAKDSRPMIERREVPLKVVQAQCLTAAQEGDVA